MVLANATDIKNWAIKIESHSLMPILIRKLIHATCNNVLSIDFPSDESVQMGGWDGVVNCTNGNAFLPQGFTGWESGCNSGVKVKADGDYETRSGNPLHLIQSETTFIFVTPRIWRAKTSWGVAKSLEGKWKNVLAYDADDLAQWLETAPSVHIWFSKLIGKHPIGASDFETSWSEWQLDTTPPTPAKLVGAGREKQVNQIRDWLLAAPSSLVICGDTKDEALGFFLASLKLFDDAENFVFASRTVIVRDIEAWQQLILSKSPMILVFTFNEPTGVGRAVSEGHHVLIPHESGTSNEINAILLPRLRRELSEQVLKGMGFSEYKSHNYAKLARRSFTAFRRKIATTGTIKTPKWSTPTHAQEILPMLMMGGWEDSNHNTNDREILKEIAQASDSAILNTLNQWSNEPDPPVRQIGNRWMIVSKEDAWELLSKYISDPILERFEEAVLKVLGIPNAQLELSRSQLLQSLLTGEVEYFSSLLKNSLAENLAILGSRNDTFSNGYTGQHWADRIVRKLLIQTTEDWKVWASLSSILPLLAEAAPDVFLGFALDGVSGQEPVLKQLILASDKQKLWGSYNNHTGLLWALETLAWSPDYLVSVSLILSKLASFDVNPDSNYMNRPGNSLNEIFSCFWPQTGAPFQNRKNALRVLREREPNIAWRLMLKLLPNHSITHSTSKPKWREWELESITRPSKDEYIATKNYLTECLVEDMGVDSARWSSLIVNINSLSVARQNSFIKQLQTVELESFSEVERELIWKSLREIVTRHKGYSQMEWALSQQIMSDLELAYNRFTPENLILKYKYLFMPSLSLFLSINPDLNTISQPIFEKHLEAITEVYASLGLKGIIELARDTIFAGEIGRIVEDNITLSPAEEQEVLSMQFSNDPSIAAVSTCYIRSIVQKNGFEYIFSLFEEKKNIFCTPTRIARLHMFLPFCQDTWDKLDEEVAVKSEYWLNCHPMNLQDTKDCERAVELLLQFNRPFNAFELLVRYFDGDPQLSNKILMDTLESLPSTKLPEELNGGTFAYDVGRILDKLEESNQIDAKTIFNLECKYYEVLHYHREPKASYQELADNPNFFIEVLCLAFLPKSGCAETRTDAESKLATRLYFLLEEWRIIPGTDLMGIINLESLLIWVNAARELAKNEDRLEVADIAIGRVLAHSSIDEDGIWPNIAVRNLLENVQSVDIEEGLEMGIQNGRGFVQKSHLEGGQQERFLMENYRKYADATRDKWPIISRILKKVSNSYSTVAGFADRDSEFEEDFH